MIKNTRLRLYVIGEIRFERLCHRLELRNRRNRKLHKSQKFLDGKLHKSQKFLDVRNVRGNQKHRKKTQRRPGGREPRKRTERKGEVAVTGGDVHSADPDSLIIKF